MGLPDPGIRDAVRTGDTPTAERERTRRTPPHILVTTPESLYILLTSDCGRRVLKSVKSVIVDELHSVAGSKRGAHLMLSRERLEALCECPPMRIGLSATVKPLDAMARFLLVRHDVLLGKVARRVNDDDVMRLLKLMLKALGKRGVPQGGNFSVAQVVPMRLRQELDKLHVEVNEEKSKTGDPERGDSFAWDSNSGACAPCAALGGQTSRPSSRSARRCWLRCDDGSRTAGHGESRGSTTGAMSARQSSTPPPPAWPNSLMHWCDAAICRHTRWHHEQAGSEIDARWTAMRRCRIRRFQQGALPELSQRSS